MKKQVLFGLAVIGMTTMFAAPAKAGISFSFRFGIPIPVPSVVVAPPPIPLPHVTIVPPCAPLVLELPRPCFPPPVFIPRPPVVVYTPPVAYCPPPVVVAPRYVRPPEHAYGHYKNHGGDDRHENNGRDHDRR